MAVQKKYVCAFCARAFTRLEHKQRHERSHTNEKPFHCMHCTSAFVRRDLLQRHCRTVHSINLSSTGVSKPTKAAGSLNVKSDKDDSKIANESDSPSPTNPVPNPVSVSEVPDPKPVHVVKPRANSIPNGSGSKNDVQDNNDLVNLLSIGKRLYQILVQFDMNLAKFGEEDLNDYFLIGYIELLNNPQFPIFLDILKKLLHYLNSNFQELSNFKIVLIYAILSVGYNVKNDTTVSIDFFSRSWNLLTMKLIPINYNNNNLVNQLEILNNLFMLNFIFLEYNMERCKQGAGHFGLNLSLDLIFNYLNDISCIIMTNLQQDKENILLLNSNMNLFWSIYILLSSYFINSYPPKFYNLFLDKRLINDLSLSEVMVKLSKSIILIESEFTKNIITCTSANELNNLTNFSKLLIYDLKNSLHNSIILINKSIISLELKNKVFEVFKKKLIINCPIKFNDLLNHYIFQPLHTYEFALLNIALKEFNYNHNYNYNFNFNMFVLNDLKTDIFKFSNNLVPFFNSPVNDINNNLGIISFPIVFNANFLSEKFNVFNVSKASDFQRRNLCFLVIEWYLTIFKIMINLQKNESLISNYIIQSLLYLLNGNDTNFKIFDLTWNLSIFRRIDTIYHEWMSFIDYKEFLADFDVNLNSFLNNFISSNLQGGSDSNYTTLKKNLSTSSTSSDGSSGPGSHPNSRGGSNPSSALPINQALTFLNPPYKPVALSEANALPAPVLGNNYTKSIILPNPERERDRGEERDLMLPPILSPINKAANVQPVVPNLHN